ncbi:MAG TPA: ABC transporter permease [Nitrolancea sp.]
MTRSRDQQMKALMAQTKMELMLTFRQFEGMLITVIFPPVLLIFFAGIGVKPSSADRPIDFLLPGMLALAVMSTGLVSLSIRTAYERNYGVLKRLGSTPLSRGQLLIAKIISVIAVDILDIIILIGIAYFFFDWHPTGALPIAIFALILGTATFSSFGLMLAGSVRPETTLAAANTLFFLFLLLGGIAWPLDKLPSFLSVPARIFPSSAFADALRDSLAKNPSFSLWNILILAAWGVVTLAIASRTFRWE